MRKILQRYPWLSVTTTLEKYIEPDYYDKLLKRYIFDGKHDLDYLAQWGSEIPRDSTVIEFGSGTGRATATILEAAQSINLTLVDLSDRMIAACQARFAHKENMQYVVADTIDFLLSTKNRYDFAYSLWSFSHSVHQNLKSSGLEKGKIKVRRAIEKFLTDNLNKNGSFSLIHFDSLSPEQRISIKQRKRDNFVFTDNGLQSPSKRLLDELFADLKQQGIIDLTSKHYFGKPLEFRSVDEALEYYLNFHMESHFNESESVDLILEELSQDIEKHRNADGVIKITPGCFIYTIKRK